MRKQTWDVVVIGAGSGGLTTAVGLAKSGKSVLLVEREHFGGECTNTGCVPSKALLHHAKTYWQAHHIAGHTTQGEAYRRSAMEYVRKTVAGILAHETAEHFEAMGMTVVRGEAVFTGPQTVQVADIAYTFNKAIIATGSSPRPLTIPGLDERDVLTNQNLFLLETIPEKILIIGAGPIGLEVGQALAMLGSAVTIATIDERVGKLEDPALRPYLISACEAMGIRFETSAHVQAVENRTAIFHRLQNDTVTETFSVPFDAVLVAIGRIPNLPQGLHAANVEHNAFGITVSSNYQTSNKRIYALGDVADRLKFTHMADTAARGVVAHILSHGLVPVHVGAIPKVTYTEPEMGQVGMGWDEAVGALGADRLIRLEVPLTKLDRAITDTATNGVLVVIVRRITGKILGAHMIGPRAGEIIALFTLAIDNKLSLWRLGKTTYAYPTYAQILKLAAMQFLAVQLQNIRSDVGTLVRRHALKATLAIAWLVGLWLLWQYLATQNISTFDLALALFDFMSTSVLAPLLFILVYTIRPITFLPATALTVLAGAFFGFWWGVVYSLIGSNLSATLAYSIGRFFGTKKTSDTTATSLFGTFAQTCRTHPFMAVLMMRLLFAPYDAVNYGAGILRVPYLPYISATVIGTVLGTILFVSLGASVNLELLRTEGMHVSILDGKFIVLSLLILCTTLLISRFLHKKNKPH